MKTLVVLRLSSMGDVAMCVPVIHQLQKQHPSMHLVFVSRKEFAPLFHGFQSVTFHTADVYGKHKGLLGLFRLYRELKAYKPNAVADLHDVLRTKLIRFFFRLSFIPVKKIDKGRAEKKVLTQKNNKKVHPIKNTPQRYAAVFQSLGFSFTLHEQLQDYSFIPTTQKENRLQIGFAPIAKHRAKSMPAEVAKDLIQQLTTHYDAAIYLLGGKSEASLFNSWEKEFPSVHSLAEHSSMVEELQAIRQLRMMISVDSANMHLASMMGVPVISVWYQTHPFAGFLGFGQAMENCVQVEDLTCRPCSVFGNASCYRGDWACITQLSTASIFKKVQAELEKK